MSETVVTDHYVGIGEAMRVANASRATLYRWEEQGEFPRRRVLGRGRVGWLNSELQEWARSRPVAA